MNPLAKRIVLSPAMWPAALYLIAAKLQNRSTATVRRGGLLLTCGTTGGQGAFCALAGRAYEKELPWLIDHIKAGDTFVDVGANIGIYSLYAARKMSGLGRVFSVEPSPDAGRVLNHNIKANKFEGIVTCVNAAASRTSGRLYLAGDSGKWNSLQLQAEPPGTPIDVTTVDAVLSESKTRNTFHFMKIDAEGVETDILEGAWESIQTSWPAIVFENSINRLRETPTDWLRARGYSIFVVSNRGKLVAAHPRCYATHINLVALHSRSQLYHS